MTWIILATGVLMIATILSVLTRDMVALVFFVVLTVLAAAMLLVWAAINYGVATAADVPEALAWGSVVALCVVIARHARTQE